MYKPIVNNQNYCPKRRYTFRQKNHEFRLLQPIMFYVTYHMKKICTHITENNNYYNFLIKINIIHFIAIIIKKILHK